MLTWRTIRQTEMSDMEQMQSIFLSVTNDDYYGAIQLATYVMAGEGDIYLLDKDNFVNYAGQGALIDLEPYIDEGALDIKGLDVSAGWRTTRRPAKSICTAFLPRTLQAWSSLGWATWRICTGASW